jgi:hypothetical protein
MVPGKDMNKETKISSKYTLVHGREKIIVYKLSTVHALAEQSKQQQQQCSSRYRNCRDSLTSTPILCAADSVSSSLIG